MVVLTKNIGGGVETESFPYTCEAIAEIGDLVYISESLPTKVEINLNNTNDQPTIGIILKKVGDTNCIVCFIGKLPITFPGLSIGDKLFLSSTGTISSTVPTTGYIQELGFCYANDKVFLKPIYTRIKRLPFI